MISAAKRGAWFCASLTFAAHCLMPVACAATGTTGDSPPPKLAEVTVTARRYTERAQDVPASLTVFTAARIQAAHIQSMSDVMTLVPNTSYAGSEEPGQLFFNVRGIGQVRNTAPAVAVVVDGVQLFDINEITQTLYDLKSIQFLKGPQGAIYGRDAIGGAVIITTKAPTDNLTGWAQGAYGTGNDRQLEGGASSALVPGKLWFRAAADVRRFNGDIENIYLHKKVNGEDSEGVHFSLISKPLQALKLDLELWGNDAVSGAAWYSYVPPGVSPNAILPIDSNVPGVSHRLVRTASLRTDYALSKVTLTSVSAFTASRDRLYQDFDFSPLNLLTAAQFQRHQTASEELRLASSDHGSVQWLLGTSYYNIIDRIDTQLFAMQGAGGVLVPFPITSPLLISEAAASQLSNAYAAFGQLRLHPLGPVHVTAALRYDEDHVHNHDFVSAKRSAANFSAYQPQITASYSLTRAAMVYASAGRGFRAGGFNANDRITGVYKAETDWSYELGTKTSWLGDRVHADAAFFYTEDYNRQIYILDQLTASETVSNPVRRARIDGLELDLRAIPLAALQVSIAAGVQDSRIQSYDTSTFAGLPAAGNFRGNRLPQVPTYTYSSAINYTVPVGDALTVTTRLEFTGSGGDYYWSLDNTAKRSPVNDINLRVTGAYHRYTVTAYVDDLTNEKHILDYEDHVWSGSPFGNFNLRSPGLRVGVIARLEL